MFSLKLTSPMLIVIMQYGLTKAKSMTEAGKRVGGVTVAYVNVGDVASPPYPHCIPSSPFNPLD